MISEIKPCPFCGGQPERNDSKIWTGTKFHIFRVFFQHLCEDVSGSQRRYMEVSGILEQEAIDCWNTRTNEATYIKKDEDGQIVPVDEIIASLRDQAAECESLRAKAEKYDAMVVVVAEYIAARNEYEAATAKPNSHAPARTLPHGSPIILRYRNAKTALYALPVVESECESLLTKAAARAERLEKAAYRAVHAYGVEPHNVQKALLELRKALADFRGEK